MAVDDPLKPVVATKEAKPNYVEHLIGLSTKEFLDYNSCIGFIIHVGRVLVLMLIQKAFLLHFSVFIFFCLYWLVFPSGGCDEDEQVQPYCYRSTI
ncbi:hypothetical protein YC2023_090283 [Brassica napus]